MGHRGKMQKEAKRQEENKSKKDSLENYYEAEKQELNNNRSRKRNVPADDDQGEGLGDHGGGHDGGGGQDIQDEDDAADGDYLNLGKVAGRDHNQNRVNIMPYIAEVERYFISDRAASVSKQLVSSQQRIPKKLLTHLRL